MRLLCLTVLLALVWTVATGHPIRRPEWAGPGYHLLVRAEADAEAAWAEWKAANGRQYASPDEEAYRRSIWAQTAASSRALNDLPDQTAWFGLTGFADMTQHEFETQVLMRDPKFAKVTEQSNSTVKLPQGYPADFDWRNQPYKVMPVTNQGRCGSCWAFATTAVLEGARSCAYASSCPALSPQYLVGCDTYDSGCNGGLVQYAISYLADYYTGLPTLSCLPYSATTSCSYACSAQVKPYNYGSGCDYTSTTLPQAVYTYGPVAVYVNASTWSSYSGGLFPSTDTQANACWNGKYNYNHAVTLVGYYTSGVVTDVAIPTNSLVVKNSWGTTWGASGYIYLNRAYTNPCGVNNYAIWSYI
eukprot:TRINITY_DN1337_c0_g1_i1.p1 TRINITY_DN1337_c0_g1~~TRINITY_DN1337_c0_g1_i1.p1  ORF type:complete len:380 (-),score=72.47 TRINITY_DN1337_c0_g1_i1:62-1138(-)